MGRVKSKKLKPPKLKRRDTSVLYFTLVPTQLKADFKSYCAKHRKSMKEAVVDFMEECVDTMYADDDDLC